MEPKNNETTEEVVWLDGPIVLNYEPIEESQWMREKDDPLFKDAVVKMVQCWHNYITACKLAKDVMEGGKHAELVNAFFLPKTMKSIQEKMQANVITTFKEYEVSRQIVNTNAYKTSAKTPTKS